MTLAKIPDSMEELTVDIDSLVPYPGNPRRGDIDAIAESLELLGQYRPIVVDRSNNHILAGNHTTKAAIKLGWKKIAAQYIDVTPEQARRIVLADNRLGDLGELEIAALLDLLEADGGALEGTGFTEQEVQRLASQFNNADLFSEPERESVGNAPDLDDEPASIQVGPYRFTVDAVEFIEWHQKLAEELREPINTNPDMDTEFEQQPKDVIRRRLGLQGAEPTVWRKPRKKKIERAGGDQLGELSDLNVPVSSLKMYPGNANKGDINGIAESLRVNGQYRSIIVSARTLHVLSGNNTWLAAMALGWDQISAVLLDVDPATERLIVLADNKLAQRASYDMDSLKALLEEVVDNPEGTGFAQEDITEILGRADEEAAKHARIWVAIKYRPDEINIRVPCSAVGFQLWIDDMREKTGHSDEAVQNEIRRRLGL